MYSSFSAAVASDNGATVTFAQTTDTSSTAYRSGLTADLEGKATSSKYGALKAAGRLKE